MPRVPPALGWWRRTYHDPREVCLRGWCVQRPTSRGHLTRRSQSPHARAMSNGGYTNDDIKNWATSGKGGGGANGGNQGGDEGGGDGGGGGDEGGGGGDEGGEEETKDIKTLLRDAADVLGKLKGYTAPDDMDEGIKSDLEDLQTRAGEFSDEFADILERVEEAEEEAADEEDEEDEGKGDKGGDEEDDEDEADEE